MTRRASYQYDFSKVTAAKRILTGYWVDGQRISDAFGTYLDPIHADLLDIVLAVYTADRKSLRTYDGSGTGQRHIQVRIGVRQPTLWERPEVKQKLSDLLFWVSEDAWALDLTSHASVTVLSDASRYLFSSAPERSATVSLFSGGLDSLAGLAWEIAKDPARTFFLVSGSTNERLEHQQIVQVQEMRKICWEIKGRPQPELRHVRVPFGINKLGWEREEATQRTRALVYLTLGAAVASQASVDTLWVYENGVGALNLPLNESQLGVDNYRGVHPVTLVLFEELLELVAKRPIGIREPFLFRTKAQVCAALADARLVNVIKETVSCDGFPQRVSGQPQCGVCTSCILRRQSLLAAGLGSYDFVHGYRVDALTPLAGLSRLQRHGLQVSFEQVATLARCLCRPDAWKALVVQFPELAQVQSLVSKRWQLDPLDVARQVVDMYRTYVKEWESVGVAA